NRVLAQYPKDVQARYGAFFAAVELEDFASAYATIDSLVNDEPIWRHYQNDPTRQANPERAYAETMAGQARYYGNQLGEAPDRPVRGRPRQRQYTFGALSSGESARLAAPRRGGGADRREPGAARRRLAHRPDRGCRQRLSLHRSPAHDGRTSGAVPGRSGGA